MEERREGAVFLTQASQKLVDLIERSADELSKNYIAEIWRDTRMPTYKKLDTQDIYRRTFSVYSQLGRWISRETTRDAIKTHWTSLGRRRREEGFPLSEIVLSLCHERRLLWNKVQDEGLIDTALDLYQALDLHHRVVIFFDLALYYAAVGYEESP
jgi:hypothetical protein